MEKRHPLPLFKMAENTFKKCSSSAVVKEILIETSTSNECYYFCHLSTDEGGNWYYLLESILAINILNISVFVPITAAGTGSSTKSDLVPEVTERMG